MEGPAGCFDGPGVQIVPMWGILANPEKEEALEGAEEELIIIRVFTYKYRIRKSKLT